MPLLGPCLSELESEEGARAMKRDFFVFHDLFMINNCYALSGMCIYRCEDTFSNSSLLLSESFHHEPRVGLLPCA